MLELYPGPTIPPAWPSLKGLKKLHRGMIKWTKQKMMIKVMTILKRLKQKVDVNLVWQEGGGGVFERISYI